MPTKRMPASRRPRKRAGRVIVQVACAAARPHLPSDRRLRALVRAAAGDAAQVALRVVGAAESRTLNRRYRGRDRPTNVLAFDLRAPQASARRPAQGDIVICHPVARREADDQRKALADHYAHLVVHGVLHLRGYDHRHAADARRMERRERRILRRFGVPDPYLVR